MREVEIRILSDEEVCGHFLQFMQLESSSTSDMHTQTKHGINILMKNVSCFECTTHLYK